jgi:hypothetical protein
MTFKEKIQSVYHVILINLECIIRVRNLVIMIAKLLYIGMTFKVLSFSFHPQEDKWA